MASSLSTLVENLQKVLERLRKGKCKDCQFCLNYMRAKNGLLVFKWANCNKNQENVFEEDLEKISVSTYKFCDDDINK